MTENKSSVLGKAASNGDMAEPPADVFNTE